MGLESGQPHASAKGPSVSQQAGLQRANDGTIYKETSADQLMSMVISPFG